MIDSKHFDKVVALIMILAVVVCMLGVYSSENFAEQYENTGLAMEYETKLFDKSTPLDINIEIQEKDWENLLENAIQEEYYTCKVKVNGTTFPNVAIRAKGNSSLSSIAKDDTTDRYSFKLEFDRFVETQTCFGLDKLILNNNYADATNMKEAMVYDMYAFLGADASLSNYATISVNGEYWGTNLALEGVEDSFKLRNYGVSNGNLYKPESMNMQGKDNPGGNMQPPWDGDMQPPGDGNFQVPGDENTQAPKDGNIQVPGDENTQATGDGNTKVPGNGNMQPPDMNKRQPPNGEAMKGIKGGMMSGNGCDLNYVDNDLDSYSSIWEGEINATGKKDHLRVVKALKNISEGNRIDTYMDVENILKYLAVHTFSVNLDSLSGNMAHNYYLYEEAGKLNMIPWDYNLSWGGFQSKGENGATKTINFPIDTPFSQNISLEDREFFAALLENEEYLEQYHGYLKKLCEEYITGGKLKERYEEIRKQIDNLVKTDPTAFYTYEEYDTAANTLYQVLELRGKSILGQLAGTIPATNKGQSDDSTTLIDGSRIDLSVMGVMQGGR